MMEVRSIETTMLEEDGSRAEACFIKTDRGALFMVTHLPAEPAEGAVVVCSPIQSELLKNNRREVMLARSLASQKLGGGSLPLHRHGKQRRRCSGSEHQRDDRGHCRSGNRAREIPRAQDRIGFLATRLGSLAATEVAAGLPGSPIALWEPVVSGSRLPKGVDAGPPHGRDAPIQ